MITRRHGSIRVGCGQRRPERPWEVDRDVEGSEVAMLISGLQQPLVHRHSCNYRHETGNSGQLGDTAALRTLGAR